jgi:uncharacterized protein YdaU (DUF1376 family)
MSKAAPSPLTEPDCDCRGLPFMPLEVTRLRDSDLVMLSTGDEFKAAVLLWSAAWLQVPAASLPDDDRILCKLSTYPMAEWLTLRDQALRGFVKCSDGRLYHPIIADHAAAAFVKRKGQETKANSRWAKERARKAAESVGIAAENATVHAVASAPAMQGTLEVEVKGKVGGGVGASAPSDWPEGDPVKALVEAVASPWLDPQKSHGLVTTAGRLHAWRQAGASWQREVIPVVTGLCAGQRGPVSTWKFFDTAIARAISDNRAVLQFPERGATPIRGSPSLTDQIAAEHAEARRRTIALLEAEHG